ncbi:Hypothetical predicted protein, partial [Paramuricea clavata]
GSGEFRPIDAIVQLSFVIADTSQYVCRKCRGSLKSWVQARHKASKIEKELEEISASSASDSRKVASVSHSIPNQHEKHEPVTECKAVQTNLSFPIETESSTSDTACCLCSCVLAEW